MAEQQAVGADVWGRARRPLLAALVICIALGGAWLAWRRIRPAVVSGRQYLVQPGDIEITPRPPWVRSDILPEVLRDPSLAGPQSILDKTFLQRLTAAFKFHPWIARVRKVSERYGPRITVDLVYRKPMLTVQLGKADEALLVLCDDQGVRLPADGFSTAQMRAYPRLIGIGGEPLVGQPWQDPRVTDAVRIVALLADHWNAWRLATIQPVRPPGPPPAGRLFQIVSRGGTRILWGRAPGNESAEELSGTEKSRQLAERVRRYGGLDQPGGPRQFDLRTPFGRTDTQQETRRGRQPHVAR